MSLVLRKNHNIPARARNRGPSGISLLDDLFGDLFVTSNTPRRTSALTPQTSVSETDEQFVISVATPGLDKKDLNVELVNDTLTVSYSHSDKNSNAFVQQSFSQSWRLPEQTKSEEVSAECKNGVLTVSVNKPTDQAPASCAIKIK